MTQLWRWLKYQWARPMLWCRVCGEPAAPDMRDCCSEGCAAQAQAFSM